MFQHHLPYEIEKNGGQRKVNHKDKDCLPSITHQATERESQHDYHFQKSDSMYIMYHVVVLMVNHCRNNWLL